LLIVVFLEFYKIFQVGREEDPSWLLVIQLFVTDFAEADEIILMGKVREIDHPTRLIQLKL
jgi:hypothetical protein